MRSNLRWIHSGPTSVHPSIPSSIIYQTIPASSINHLPIIPPSIHPYLHSPPLPHLSIISIISPFLHPSSIPPSINQSSLHHPNLHSSVHPSFIHHSIRPSIHQSSLNHPSFHSSSLHPSIHPSFIHDSPSVNHLPIPHPSIPHPSITVQGDGDSLEPL